MSTTQPSAYKYKVGGSLEIDAPSYVKRQADEDFYNELKKGEFCYVLNSRQMGKSSLRVQTMRRLQEDGIACSVIDISAIGSQGIEKAEWYLGVLRRLVRSFTPKVKPLPWWSEHEGLAPVQRLSEFIEEVLLAEVSQSIVIFIDEIDSVLKLDFKDDFFALIRACYNNRADNPAYQRLTFALLGVATPSDLIQDKNRTPFNVGRAIELHGFQLHEAQPLAKGLSMKVSNPQAVLTKILTWTGGQPFLTQKLCELVLASPSFVPAGDEAKWVEDLVRLQVIEHWEATDNPEHLKTIRDRILRNQQRAARLLGLYQQVLQQGEVAADGSPEQMELRLSGLIVEQQGKLRVYNRIYRSVFNQNWVGQELKNLRPYAEALGAWVASNYQDESRLLRGQALLDAQVWAEDKSLNSLDYQFLSDSYKYEVNQFLTKAQQKVELALEEEKKANQRLAEAQQKAKWQIRVGSTILAVSLVGAVTAVGWVIRDFRIEQVDTLNSTSNNLLASNQPLEALIASVKAGKQLQGIIGGPNELQAETVGMLRQAVNATEEINRLEGHEGEVYSVSFSPDGKTIATASEDKTVKLWSRDGKDLKQFLQGHRDRVWSVSFLPYDQKAIATTSWDGTIRLWSWDGKKSRALTTLKGHQGWVFGVSFSPDRQMIASVGADKMVRLWSRDGKLQRSWHSRHKEYVVDVAFSPNGKTIATASDDGTAKLWNPNGTLRTTLERHRNQVNSVAFSPNGKTIATASDDGTTKLWNLNGTLRTTLEGHSEPVMSASFSPDGKTIATASFDDTVKLWNLNGALLETFRGHRDWVWDVSFSPDGKTLASTSRDKTAILWRVDNTEPQKQSLDVLLVFSCNLLRDYLKNNLNVQENDRRLCDGTASEKGFDTKIF